LENKDLKEYVDKELIYISKNIVEEFIKDFYKGMM